ncbi:MAG: flagellin [Nitrospirae bacterium]|nr:flagellin [Nitrospirota bacterium]
MLRVTSQLQIAVLKQAIMSSQQDVFRVQQEIASGKKLSRPSQNPSGMREVTGIRSFLDITETRKKSIDLGISRLQLTEDTVGKTTDLILRARELALVARNDTTSAADRILITEEVQQILAGLVDLANARIDGRYIFSGYETQTAAYTLSAASASAVPPVVVVNDNNTGATSTSVAIQTASSLTGHEYSIEFTTQTNFNVIDQTTGVTTLSNQTYASGGNIDFDGLRVVLTNNLTGPLGGDQFTITAHNDSDATVAVGIIPSVTPDATNTGTASASAVSVSTVSSLTGAGYTINFPTASTYTVVNNVTSSTVASGAYSDPTVLAFEGLSVTVTGSPLAGDSLDVTQTNSSLRPDIFELRFTSTTTYDVVDLTTNQVLSTGNAYTSGGNIVFSGLTTVVTDGTVAPQSGDVFRVRADYTYQGDTGGIAIEVGDGKTVTTNMVGSQVFSGQLVDLFDTLQDFNEALFTNNTTTLATITTNLDLGIDQLTGATADVGGRTNRLETFKDSIELLSLNLQSRKSFLEDTDLAQAAAELAQFETNLNASLLVLERQFRISLLNFIS